MNGYKKLGLEWNLSAVKFEAIVCLGIFCPFVIKIVEQDSVCQKDLFLLYMHNICNIFSLHLRQIFDRYTKLFLALEDKILFLWCDQGIMIWFLGNLLWVQTLEVHFSDIHCPQFTWSAIGE